MKQLAFLIFSLFPFLLQSQQLPESDDEMLAFQQLIVGKLSGVHPLDDGAILNARSSSDEREVTANFLVESFRELGLTPKVQSYRSSNNLIFPDFFFSPATGKNIYATLFSTTLSNEFVIIGAHYDSEPNCPGAGDNASGVALVLSLAKQMKNIKHLPKNVMFVLFDQEEDDEIGSRAFASWIRKEEIIVHSIHITDLAGWDEDGDRVVKLQSAGPSLEPIYQRAAQEDGISLDLVGGASSDNKSFLKRGFPTAGVFGDVTRHLHKPSDTYETVDFEFLGLMTNLILDAILLIQNEKHAH